MISRRKEAQHDYSKCRTDPQRRAGKKSKKYSENLNEETKGTLNGGTIQRRPFAKQALMGEIGVEIDVVTFFFDHRAVSPTECQDS